MGGLPKKFTVLRALLLCLAVVFSLVSITASVSLFHTADHSLPSPSDGEQNDVDEDEFYTEWINLASGYFTNRDDLNKTVLITSEGELANLNRVITEDNNYSGWTFTLGRNLDMARYKDNLGQDRKPVWTPINPVAGRNTGIIIDGNGYKISNLLIKMDDDATKANGVRAKNGVGFFGNLAGCTVRNLTFENPVIEYSYKGDSKSADDSKRPTAPVKVAVGVVAGIAENAYISNVTLVNPKVEVTTNNANGHSIYVGATIGKMVYSDQSATPLLNSLTNPDEEPEHRWGVDSVTVNGGKVELNVNAGEGATGAYGVATNGYIGGLVGYNNSGKIINSKVKHLNVNPQINGAAGTYHAGGLVGYTITRAKSEQDADYNVTVSEIAFGGVINNVIVDAAVTNGQATNTGLLVGYVYNSWIYNNLYLGDIKETDKFFGAFYNRFYYAFADSCLGKIDYETFLNNSYFKVITDETVDEIDKACNVINNGRYAMCGKHGGEPYLGIFFPNAGQNNVDASYETYANNYNYKKTKAEFVAFQKSDEFKKLDDFENTDGNFYEIGTQKVKHEYQTDVDATTIRRAVNELRVWQVDIDNEPQFGDNLGYDYDVIFHANGNNMKDAASEAGRCNAGWVVKGDYIDTINTELVKKAKYKEPILALAGDDVPTCEGWSFAGWYEDEQCTREFKFTDAQMGVNRLGTDETGKIVGIHIYAKWTVNYYNVTYYLADDLPYSYENDSTGQPMNVTETVKYGWYVKGPEVAPDLSKINDPRFFGKSFTGNWYIMTEVYEGYDEFGKPIGDPVPTRGQDWVFGNVDGYTPMPGNNIKLYADLQDDFVVLREELESTEVTDAFKNKDCYTEESFSRFQVAYDNAFAVMEAYNAGKLGDEDLREKTVEQIIDELHNSLAALTVDIAALKNLPPLRDKNSDQNTYPFLYDYNAYKEYTEIKRTAQNYLDVEIKNEGMLNDVERYKYIRDTLMTKYNNLAANLNPNIGVDESLKAEVKRSYTQIMAEIDTFNSEDYTAESWKDSNFELYCSRFKEAFKSDYSNPNIADLKAAIDNYNHAKSQLVRGQGGSGQNTPGANNTAPKAGGMSPIVIGVLVALAAVIGAGAYVGVDLYLNKKVRPKKEQAEKAEQAAADDTYI